MSAALVCTFWLDIFSCPEISKQRLRTQYLRPTSPNHPIHRRSMPFKNTKRKKQKLQLQKSKSKQTKFRETIQITRTTVSIWYLPWENRYCLAPSFCGRQKSKKITIYAITTWSVPHKMFHFVQWASNYWLFIPSVKINMCLNFCVSHNGPQCMLFFSNDASGVAHTHTHTDFVNNCVAKI